MTSATKHRAITAVESRVAAALGNLGCDARSRFLVAVSGGADSAALLHALQRLGRRLHFHVAAAHLNHGLRGLESDRDEEFVRGLCRQLQVELVVERAHGLKRVNLEERARELRYEFLNRTADALKAHFIALGHHRDDQAETVVLRLLRGAGIAGLAAMAEAGPGRLIRPLLSLERRSIFAYLAAIGADYVVDSSNYEAGALRNRVRAELMPLLARDYSPRIGQRLAELAAEMREVDSYLAAEARRSLAARLVVTSTAENHFGRMMVVGIKSISPALVRAILRQFIRHVVGDLRRIERAHIEAMWLLAVGEHPSGSVSLPGGWRFRREYDTVVLESRPPAAKRQSPPVPNRTEVSLLSGLERLNVGGFALAVRELAPSDPAFPNPPWHPADRFEAYFDAEGRAPLAVRCVRRGDRIRPLGLVGSRKLHDVFIDNKVPVASRQSWPVVVLDEEVVWIPGLVRSGIALVTAASKKVLHLRADRIEPG